MKGFQKILVPIDGSKISLKSLAHANYLAENCHASVGVLYVVNFSLEMSSVGQIDTGGYIPDQVLEDIQETGRVIVDKALQEMSENISAEGFVEIGAPAEVIVKFCKDNGYDLIVMGSRGLGKIKEFMLGSVSSYVLHYACCPVMVAK